MYIKYISPHQSLITVNSLLLGQHTSFFWDFFQSKRCLFYVHLSSHSPRSLECWQKGFSVTRYMYLNVSCQWTDNSLSYYKTVSTTPRLSKLLRFSVNTFAFCLNCIVCHRHQEAAVLKLEDKESTTMPFPMKTAKHVCYSTGKWQHGYWIWWIKYLADRKWDKNWLAGITATEVDVTGLQSRLVS